jgi:hypothetical protein
MRAKIVRFETSAAQHANTERFEVTGSDSAAFRDLFGPPIILHVNEAYALVVGNRERVSSAGDVDTA